ncbi:unnamed protein product [Urochloa humidicola]
MAASQEEERDWSELPADLVRKCAGRLQCDQDRMNMQLQCRAWRQAIRPMPRSPSDSLDASSLPSLGLAANHHCQASSLLLLPECSCTQASCSAIRTGQGSLEQLMEGGWS